MSLLFRLLCVLFHFREQFRLGRALVCDLLATKGIMLGVAGLALGGLWRACSFVVHDKSPMLKGV